MFMVVLLALGLPYLFFSWRYLFFSRSYDKSFNAERIQIGQPIIEDYFIPKFENAKRRQIWYAPDSLKFERIHTGKLYATENGEIIFESDSYRKKSDTSAWFRLSREYYFKKDSVAYYLEIYTGKKRLDTDTLSRNEGDSILTVWKGN
jgi:hypothetical protein